MREIKFRGKVRYNGQHFFSGDFVEGYYAYKELDGKHIILVERPETMRHASYFVEIEVDAETIGQYTGLKDKNGVEIYEGDILKCRTMEGKTMPFTVVWSFIRNGWLAENNDEIYDVLASNFFDTKVIGNIHDKETI